MLLFSVCPGMTATRLLSLPLSPTCLKFSVRTSRLSISIIWSLLPNISILKFSRLDLRLDVDGRIVNIEIQVNRETDFKERTLFYWSKFYSEKLEIGDEYGELKQTICIGIINLDLFDCEDYHSRFNVLETERHEVQTEKLDIHFFELKKLSKFKKKR